MYGWVSTQPNIHLKLLVAGQTFIFVCQHVFELNHFSAVWHSFDLQFGLILFGNLAQQALFSLNEACRRNYCQSVQSVPQ